MQIKSLLFFVLSTAVALCAGCKPEAGTPPSVKGDQAKDTVNPKHELPPSNRVWTANDMAQAVEALRRRLRDDPQSMPRYEGYDSEAFARLVATENLNVLRDTSIPFDDRLAEWMRFQQQTMLLLALYYEAFQMHAVEGADVVELNILQINMFSASVDLANERSAQIKGDEIEQEDHEVRRQAIAAVGLRILEQGPLGALGQPERYSQASRKKLLARATAIIPQIVALAPDSRERLVQIAARYRRLDATLHFGDDVKPALQEFEKQLIGDQD
jgi:hypothetical protein